MCKGAESKYFNGHTNIRDDKFLVFGVKGIMELNRSLRDALLFSILSYITYTVELTEAQYAALLDRAAELEIPLEDLLLQAIQNQVKEREHHA